MPDQLMTGMEFPSLCTIRMLTHDELDQWVDYGLLRVLRREDEDEDEDEDDEDEGGGDEYYMEPLDGYASCSVGRHEIRDVCGLAVETPNHPGFVYLVDYLGSPISLGLGCEPIPGALPAWLFTLEEDQHSQIVAQLFIDQPDRMRSLLDSLSRVYPVDDIQEFLMGSDIGRELLENESVSESITAWCEHARTPVEAEAPQEMQAERYTIRQALEDSEALRLATRWANITPGLDLVRQAALAEPYNAADAPLTGSPWGIEWSVVRDLTDISTDRPLRVVTDNEIQRLVELNVIGHERDVHRYYFGGQHFPERHVSAYHFPREDYRFLRHDRETHMAVVGLPNGWEADVPVWMLAYADCVRIPEDPPTEVAGLRRGQLVQLRPPTELFQEMEQHPDTRIDRTIARHYINYRGVTLDLTAYRQAYDTGPRRLTRFADERSVLLDRSTVPLPIWALVRGGEDQERRRHQVIPRQDVVVGQVVELLDVQELRDLANHPDFTVQEARVVHEPEPHLALDIARYERYTWRQGQFVVTNTFDDAVVNYAVDDAGGTRQTMTMIRVRPIDDHDSYDVPYWVLRAVEDTTTEQPQAEVAEAETPDRAARLLGQIRLGQTVRLLTRRQLCTRAGYGQFPNLRLLGGDRIVDDQVDCTLFLSGHTFREQRGELLCVVDLCDNYMVGVATYGGSRLPVLRVPYWALDIEHMEVYPPPPSAPDESIEVNLARERIRPGVRVWQLTRYQMERRAVHCSYLHLSEGDEPIIQDTTGETSLRLHTYTFVSVPGAYVVVLVPTVGDWVTVADNEGNTHNLPFWAFQPIDAVDSVTTAATTLPPGDEMMDIPDIPNLRKPSVVALMKLRQCATHLEGDPSDMTDEQRIQREKVIKLLGRLLPEMIDWVFIGMKSQE